MRRCGYRDYYAHTDGLDKRRWTDIVSQFDDASLYQTWSFGAVRSGEDNLSHLVLRKGGHIVAAAQLRIVELPIVTAGIAYVTWGPLWRLQGSEVGSEIFRQMVRALREEYAGRRHLLLRLVPNEMEEDGEAVRSHLSEEGFRRNASPPPHQIVMIDLRRGVTDFRKSLRPSWRADLSRSQRNRFEVTYGNGLDFFNAFTELYEEMVRIKQLPRFAYVDEYRRIQEDLPPAHKMEVILCKYEGRPVSGILWSGVGKTAVTLFAATNEEGRKLRVSYYAKWCELLREKELGYKWSDYGGIDPERNPEGVRFKTGILGKAGENGSVLRRIGEYDAFTGVLSRSVVRCGDLLRSNYRRLRTRISRA